MTITNKIIFRGCLIASISHAIMTNMYPDLAYEQSWDGKNYSIQDSANIRGTITFEKEYCVGAIRNELSRTAGNINNADKIMHSFPAKIIATARQETLQYLLNENNGKVFPDITSVFWADSESLHCEQNSVSILKEDFNLLSRIVLPQEDAFKAWQEYYEMNEKTVELIKTIVAEKEKSFDKKLFLSEEHKKYIPGNGLCIECIESLNELNIFCE